MGTVKNYIFFDFNAEHKMLAGDISQKDPKAKIYFVDKVENFGSEEWKAFSKSASVQKISAEHIPYSEELYKKIFSLGAARFFLLSKNPDRNVSLALNLMEYAKKFEVAYDLFELFIAPNWQEIEGFLLKCQDELFKCFNIRMVNVGRLGALSLFKEYKPVNFMKFDENLKALSDFKVALVGWNHNLIEATLNNYVQSCFEGANFICDVYDVSTAIKKSLFEKRFSGLVKSAKFSFIELNNYAHAKSALSEKLKDYNLIMVDVGDIAKNCELAKHFADFLFENRAFNQVIAVRVDSLNDIDFPLEKYPNIKPFGYAQSIFTRDIILEESYLQSGKIVNDFYNSKKTDAAKMKNWKGMNEFERGSNVSVADFNYAFVSLIGNDKFLSFKNGDEYRKWLADNPKIYDTLIRTEHNRWCAYLYANGWDVLPLPAQQDDVLGFNKDSSKKQHACLVPFDDLDKLSDMFGEDFKQYDADNVSIVYEIREVLTKQKGFEK